MCDICDRLCQCNSRCPNYIPKKSEYYCSICGEGISEGENYIENTDNEYIHFECVQGMRHLLKLLGYEVKIMEEYD